MVQATNRASVVDGAVAASDDELFQALAVFVPLVNIIHALS